MRTKLLKNTWYLVNNSFIKVIIQYTFEFRSCNCFYSVSRSCYTETRKFLPKIDRIFAPERVRNNTLYPW